MGSWRYEPSGPRKGWLAAVRHSKDPTVFTVLFEDTAAIAGLFLALAGILLSGLLNAAILDGIASLVIGLYSESQRHFWRGNVSPFSPAKGVSADVQASLHAIAASEPIVSRVNEILTMHFGPDDVLAALSLDFVNSRSAEEIEQAVTRLEQQLKKAHPEIKHAFIEAQDREAPSLGPTSSNRPTGHAVVRGKGKRAVDSLRGPMANYRPSQPLA